VAVQQLRIRRAAARYRKQLRRGDAVGRLHVPQLGLNAILVEGTDHASLQKGPGRYTRSYVPGEGELIYIAGHRTTYGAPLAHIDRLKKGDEVRLEVPYGTFVYRVSGHLIVPADDIGRLRTTGREEVALQACHPRFFATERYIVYARPVAVKPRGGKVYAVGPRSAR
jgi:sortase A